MQPLRLDVVSDPAAFTGLRGDWDALLSASDQSSVFLSWEWLHTWWTILGPGRGLHLVRVRRGDRLVGLAPLFRRPAGLLPERLEMLGTGIVGSDHLDVVVARDEADAALALVADHVGELGLPLDLRQLGAGSRALGLAARLQERGWRSDARPADVCPYLRLEGHDWDSLLQTLGPQHRANVRRRIRKLHERGLRLQVADSEVSRHELLAVLFRLHGLRFAARGGSDAFDAPGVTAFHEEATRLALERGWLRLFALWVDGEPVAALYGLMHCGRFSFYQSGFDPAQARWSVGLVMLALSIRHALDEGAREYDLLHGDESYKFLWSHGVRELVRLEADPPGATAAARRAARTLTRAARRTLRGLLPTPLALRLAALRRQWAPPRAC